MPDIAAWKLDIFPTCPDMCMMYWMCLKIFNVTGAQPQEAKVFQLSSDPALNALFGKVILQIILNLLFSIFMGYTFSAPSTDWVCSSFWAVLVACSAVMARVWLAFCLLFFLFTSTACLDVSQILGRFLSFFFCWFKCTVLLLIVCEFILLHFHVGSFL